MEKNTLVKNLYSIEKMYHSEGSVTFDEKTVQFVWKPCDRNVWDTFLKGVHRDRVSWRELTGTKNFCGELK